MNIKWCVKTLREIAHPTNQGGYTKLIQIALMTILLILFCLIVLYYIKNPTKVDRIDIILTVIVGWLGLIIGGFFGEKSMETLQEKRDIGVRKADLVIKKYENFIDDILRKLEKK